jgi:5-methylcytosine-specific restriction endonuclease McrA
LLLNNKTDVQILSELKTWVGKEREAVTHVLHYLREVEERKLYLQEASSLKEFCMKVLRYSRHEAQARVDAMRLLKVVPEIDADIDAGRLSLTVAAQTMSNFRKDDKRREDLGLPTLSDEERKTVLADLMNSSTREADRKLAFHFPDQPQSEKTRPVSETITRIEFNANQGAMRKFERLLAYHFHKTGGSWEKLFELLADHEIERLDTPPRRARGSNKTSSSKTVVRSRSRYVRKQIHHQIWSNWERGCDHILTNGGRCGTRKNLQQDHIIEFSEGGKNELENLRLLCGAHNRYRSDRLEKLRQEFLERAANIHSQCLEQLFIEAVRYKGAVVSS